MITTKKGDTCELLLFFFTTIKFIELISRTLREIGTKEHCFGRSRRNVKNYDYENGLAKTEFYALNRKQNIGC